MDAERSDFVVSTGHPPGTGRMAPQYHYRCEECDAEYVSDRVDRLRLLDGREIGA
jgi:hypothetical protein